MKYEPDAAVVSNLSSPPGEDSGSDDRSGVENFSDKLSQNVYMKQL